MKTPATTAPHSDSFPETLVKPGSSIIEGIVPDMKSLFDLVSEQPFFKGLNTYHLQLLTDSAMEMQFEIGQELLHEGNPANRFYLILEGKVVLESELAERGSIPIQTLGPSDDLGWSWLFPPYLLNVTARALTPTRTIFFYATRLREQCEQDHDLGFRLLQRVAEVLIQRLETTQQRLVECIVTNKLSSPPAT